MHELGLSTVYHSIFNRVFNTISELVRIEQYYSFILFWMADHEKN